MTIEKLIMKVQRIEELIGRCDEELENESTRHSYNEQEGCFRFALDDVTTMRELLNEYLKLIKNREFDIR